MQWIESNEKGSSNVLPTQGFLDGMWWDAHSSLLSSVEN